MEYLDILDENGNKVGIESREIASKKKLIYKTVYLWIISNGKIFIQQRAFSKKTNPGMWDCAVAGHVLAGEEGIDAIVRETKEELNLDINKNELKLIYSNIGFDNKYQFHDVYLLKKDIDINSIKIQKEEVNDFKLVTLDEVKKLINDNKFSNNFHNKEVLNYINNYLNKI